MKVNIVGKDIKPTEAIEDFTNKKLERIQKYFDKDINVDVTLREEGNVQIVEMKVAVRRSVFRSIAEEKDIYAAIDKNIDILEGQIRKAKTIREKRRKEQNKDVEFIDDDEDGDLDLEDEIIRYATYDIKPMDPEDAKMILSEHRKHIFMPFINIQTGKVNVIYKLKDGKNYGLIEPEA